MPILKPDELDVMSHSAEQTRRLGMRMGKLLQPGDAICLSGDMGAGKTVFTSGICAGWGSTYPATSPTFTLVHEHRRRADDQRLYHIDCYRIESHLDARSAGLDDILDVGDGVIVIEWPENIEDMLPEKYLWLELRIVDDTRRNFFFEGIGQRFQDLIRQFREASFGI